MTNIKEAHAWLTSNKWEHLAPLSLYYRHLESSLNIEIFLLSGPRSLEAEMHGQSPEHHRIRFDVRIRMEFSAENITDNRKRIQAAWATITEAG